MQEVRNMGSAWAVQNNINSKNLKLYAFLLEISRSHNRLWLLKLHRKCLAKYRNIYLKNYIILVTIFMEIHAKTRWFLRSPAYAYFSLYDLGYPRYPSPSTLSYPEEELPFHYIVEKLKQHNDCKLVLVGMLSRFESWQSVHNKLQ